jgi:hypothetical protein
MNNYYPQLLIALSLNYLISPPPIIQFNNKANQQRAVERFFMADRLSPSWFTPSTLKTNDLSELQKKRDDLNAKIKQRYGKYQRVELIKGDRYRIIFENANLDMVIAKFSFDSIDRINEIEMQIDWKFID